MTSSAAPSRTSVATSRKRCSAGPASARATLSWCAPRTLIPSRGAWRSTGQVVDPVRTQMLTNGGSSDTGTNVLTARPAGAPSTSAHTATTPVGNRP